MTDAAKSPLTWSLNQWGFLQKKVCFWQTGCFCRSGINFGVISVKKFSPYWWKEIRSEKHHSRIAREIEKKNVLDQDFSIHVDFYSLFNWHVYSNSHVKNFYPWLNLQYFISYSQAAYWKKSDAFCPLRRNSVQHPTYSWEAVLQQRAATLPYLGIYPFSSKSCANLFMILAHKQGRPWCVLRRTLQLILPQ